MARYHFVKKALKDNSVCKKGESYYWWAFRFGGKHYSKEPPKPSQLTQSAFLSQVYDLNDQISALSATDSDDLRGQLDSIAEEFRTLADECESNRSNMPESLQESDSGILLEERSNMCNEIADNLENIDTETGIQKEDILEEVKEDLGEDAKEEDIKMEVESRIEDKLQEFIDEAQSYQYEGQ